MCEHIAAGVGDRGHAHAIQKGSSTSEIQETPGMLLQMLTR